MDTLLDALRITAGPTLAALAVGAVALWLVSLARRDASVADPAWAPAFLLVGVVSALAADAARDRTATAIEAAARAASGGDPGVPLAGASGVYAEAAADPGPRGALVLACVAVWAARLGRHLLRRNLAHGEDPRYVAMRAAHGPRFPWVSLFTVFLLQAGLAWAVSLPVQAAVASRGSLGPLDYVAAALFAAGFLCEAVADVQLARFRADPASRGAVLDTGLWRYSRHPNYFGNAVLWWGLGLFAVAAGAWPALVGPAIMTVLLLKVSGVALLEKDIGARRPDYAAHIRRTSAFVPWFPRRG